MIFELANATQEQDFKVIIDNCEKHRLDARYLLKDWLSVRNYNEGNRDQTGKYYYSAV